MPPELIVRLYNVGVGDCIYLRVPDKKQTRHILIDCGSMNRYGEKAMGAVLANLEECLPKDASGTPLLDLLVITHSHQDHMSALNTNLEWFRKLRIRRIWMSAAMQAQYAPAKKIQALWEQGKEVLQALQGLKLGGQYDDLLHYLSFALSNAPALNALRNDLKVEQRLYLDTETPEQSLDIFTQPDTRFHVLNPAHDLDEVYLGAFQAGSGHGFAGILGGKESRQGADKIDSEQLAQHNISSGDFQRLTEHLSSNALGFLLDAVEGLENNTSLVLLLEWHGKRLLFAADAEYKDSGNKIYVSGENNFAWNFMWHAHRTGLLSQPLDFLKVGHHGSMNATPWSEKNPPPAINKILDTLVKPDQRPCQIGVSAERWSKYQRTIPYKALMLELGARAQKGCLYEEEKHYKKVNQTSKQKIKLEYCVDPGKKQPKRTDLNYQDPELVHPLYLEFKFDA
jgi:beta-lactamase superfamily II metal-dependent hydrolase